jgi:arginase family enzyme
MVIKDQRLQRKTINAINFDAHSDFRILEGRHSGNGFSYAYEEGFLKKYFVLVCTKTIPLKVS